MEKLTKPFIESKIAKYINLRIKVQREFAQKRAKIINKRNSEDRRYNFVARTIKDNLPSMDKSHKAKYEKALDRINKIHSKFMSFMANRLAKYQMPK